MASYATDPRRSFILTGAADERSRHRKPEPHTSLPQALLMGICVACFAAGVLLLAAGLS